MIHDGEVHVREHPMPGSARLFSLTLGDGSVVTVSTPADSMNRTLQVTPPASDESMLTLRFNAAESTTLAALLSGIRFVVEQPAERQPVDAANLRTVTLPAGAPAIGKRLHDLESSDDAMVIAVIRDDTDDLIEKDPDRPCEAGDRLVVVGRPGSMSRAIQFLTG
ncbi:MAG: cation:proton antiporter regulatory subunit [Ilumatobacter sp.]|uniref:cation:proton antiporter regulatory subunit n=1 Tax=Ilumatobacter sp. TaxID=1967498 RepID=UPI00391A3830